MTSMQKSFIEALEQQRTTLTQQQAEQEARHQRTIEALQEEVRNLKIPMLGPQDRTLSPEANIRNASPKLVVVIYPIEPTTILIRSKKLLDPLVFTSK